MVYYIQFGVQNLFTLAKFLKSFSSLVRPQLAADGQGFFEKSQKTKFPVDITIKIAEFFQKYDIIHEMSFKNPAGFSFQGNHSHPLLKKLKAFSSFGIVYLSISSHTRCMHPAKPPLEGRWRAQRDGLKNS